MTPKDKAKRTLLAVEMPRDQLALRIAEACIGMKAPPGCDPAAELAKLEGIPSGVPGVCMAESFRRAADKAVLFFHERINAARQPS